MPRKGAQFEGIGRGQGLMVSQACEHVGALIGGVQCGCVG